MDDDMEVFGAVYDGERSSYSATYTRATRNCSLGYGSKKQLRGGSDIEFARAAHKYLGVPVLCDPGEEISSTTAVSKFLFVKRVRVSFQCRLENA